MPDVNKPEEKTAVAEAAAVTEEELRKSIEALEKPKVEEKAKEEPAVVTPLAKSVKETVTEKANENLKKALEVSEALKNFSDVVGMHIDGVVELFQKSLNEAALRDAAFLRVIKDQNVRIEELEKAVKEFGKAPVGAPATQPTVAKTEVLAKAADTEDKKISKREVSAAFESLIKSTKDPVEAQVLTRAAIAYDATGILPDAMLFRVKKELGK